MAIALDRARRLSLFGWLRTTARLGLLIGWLCICIPAYYLARLIPGRNRVPRAFLAGVAILVGVRLTIIGHKVDRGSFQLVNHVSWIDIPALAAATGSAFIGHDGLATMPLLKWLCTMNETVFVARHDRASVHGQIEQVRTALRDTGTLAIFPEGTTSDGTGLLAFKSSLLSALEPIPAGIAVQPVLLDYGPESAAIAWVGDESGLDNFVRILARRRPIRLTLRFLPPLSGEQLANRKTISAAARESLLAALQASHRS